MFTFQKKEKIFNKFQRITRRFRYVRASNVPTPTQTEQIPERISKKDCFDEMFFRSRHHNEMASLGYDMSHYQQVTVETRHYSRDNVSNLSQFDVQSKDVDARRDQLVSLIEDAAWCTYLISRNPTARGIAEAAFTFVKLRFNGSVAVAIYKSELLEKFSQILNVDVDEKLKVESIDVLYTARQTLGSYKDLVESPIYKKLYKCLMYAISLDLFDKAGLKLDSFGYGKMEKAILKRKFYNKSDFIYTIFDTILFILERGVHIYKTGDISSIVHSGSSYATIYEKASELKRKSMHLSNAEAHGFKESTFLKELDDLIEKLLSIKKHGRGLDQTERSIINHKYDEMCMIRDDITSLSACRQMRDMPFGILIVGDSGIGKSTLTQYIFQYFANICGLEADDAYKYTHNYFAKHWNNFKSCCWCIIMDDVAAENPSLGDNSSVREIIQVMNPVPYCPEQAALEDKGKTPCKAKLVIATSNIEHLNAYHYFSYPSAVQRRFPYIITPTVKPCYTNEQGMLDSSLIDDDKPYKDLWTFKVEMIIPQKIASNAMKSLATKKTILENATQQEFFMWFRDTVVAFKANQERVNESLSELKNSKNCICCDLPDQMCLNIQSEDIEYFASELPWMIFQKMKSTSVYKFMRRIVFFLYVTFYLSTFYDKCSEKMVQGLTWVDENVDIDYWRSMGEKVKKHYRIPLYFGTAATTIYVAYSVYRMFHGLQVQGGVTSEFGSAPKDDTSKRENVWYKNEVNLTPFEVSRESASAKSSNFEDFKKRIARNCVSARIKNSNVNGNVWRPSKMTCVTGHIYMVNNHCIPDIVDTTIIKIVESADTHINGNCEFTICEKDVVRYPERDLAFITIRNLPPKKNIVKYFISEKIDGPLSGETIGREFDGSMNGAKCDNMRLMRQQNINTKETGKIVVDLWSAKSNDKSKDGDCGSLLTVQTDLGYILAGIHFARDEWSNNIILQRVTREDLEDAVIKMNRFSVESGSFNLITAPTKERSVTTLHKKSVFRYIPQGLGNLYGSFEGFRGKMKSCVETTPMVYHLEGYKIKNGPPVMGSYEPWRIAALDLVAPIMHIRTDVLDLCKESYLERIMAMEDAKFSCVQVLDDFSAINGQAGVVYIDKMNRNTSAGNPWKKSKKYFLSSIPPVGQNLDPVSVDLEIDNRMDEILSNYLEGKCSHPNFCAHLKDEPVTFKKIKMGKTRVFTGAPMDWSLIVRKFLLSCTKLIQENRFVFEAGPGTIAQSLEWQEIRNYVTRHGEDRIIAGDYKAFDKKMSPKEILAAFDILYAICERSGNYNEQELRVIQCIAEDTAFPLVDYNGDLIQFYGSNPSGNPLTVILNSIVNSLRMRYVYYHLNPAKECKSFNDNVNLMTYGDDNIMSVSPKCDWFNHTAVAEEFAKIDIVYTMADKETESVPFIHIDEASFLKRTWWYDEDMACYLAPLEHESIEKMLTVWNRSKSIPKEAQAIAVIGTALREYFFYGRPIFEEKRKMFMELVEKMEIQNWVEDSTFPTYQSLADQFWQSSAHLSHVINVQSGDFHYSEWDVLVYPTSQSSTNYDISVHNWSMWAQMFDVVMQSVVFSMLFSWEIIQIRRFMIPSNLTAQLSSWYMAGLCRKRIKFVFYYFAAWFLANITHRLICMVWLHATEIPHFIIPYFAIRYCLRR